jgi:hypothetical protein
MSWTNSAEGQPFATREETGMMQFIARDQRKQSSDEEPCEAANEEKQDRRSARRIDIRNNGALGSRFRWIPGKQCLKGR